MTPRNPRFAYPIVLDLTGVPALVVGGGSVGARKAEGLTAAGAEVKLVAITVSQKVNRSNLSEICQRAFEPEDLEGIQLVVAATGNPDTDHLIAEQARDRGIWTNAADQPDDCDFILPAIARSGRVTITVSTDGASPALAKYLRDQVATYLTAEITDLAEELNTERIKIRADGGSTEHIDWHSRITKRLALKPKGKTRN